MVGAGLWAASAIAVAGYTWRSMTGQYETFPTLGGGSNPAPTQSLLPGVLPKTSTPIPTIPQLITHPVQSLGELSAPAAQPITPQGVGIAGFAAKAAQWLANSLPFIGNGSIP